MRITLEPVQHLVFPEASLCHHFIIFLIPFFSLLLDSFFTLLRHNENWKPVTKSRFRLPQRAHTWQRIESSLSIRWQYADHGKHITKDHFGESVSVNTAMTQNQPWKSKQQRGKWALYFNKGNIWFFFSYRRQERNLI